MTFYFECHTNLHIMKLYFHATSYQNALQIIKNGFKKGKSGMFGAGIYFAEKPENALRKALHPILDCIIIVIINIGRCKNEQFAHRNWNMQIVNSLGYDSVEMRNCKTGPEICIYDPKRIEMVSVVHWTQNNIEFNEISNLDVDLKDFLFIIENRKVSITKSCHTDCFPHNFQFYNSSSFNGILNYVKNTNTNLISIRVSSTNPRAKNNLPENIINYNDDESSFCTKDQPNQWICIDFKHHTVIPQYYSIRTFNAQSNFSHLRSWVIEGSNNNFNWTILDYKSNCSHLNGPKHYHSYPIYNPNNNSFRFLRILQTDLNWGKRNNLKLNCIEFYGEII